MFADEYGDTHEEFPRVESGIDDVYRVDIYDEGKQSVLTLLLRPLRDPNEARILYRSRLRQVQLHRHCGNCQHLFGGCVLARGCPPPDFSWPGGYLSFGDGIVISITASPCSHQDGGDIEDFYGPLAITPSELEAIGQMRLPFDYCE
ncbi:MAG: hypothetical protein AAB360_01225 [Patescibacteria group bacterium]